MNWHVRCRCPWSIVLRRLLRCCDSISRCRYSDCRMRMTQQRDTEEWKIGNHTADICEWREGKMQFFRLEMDEHGQKAAAAMPSKFKFQRVLHDIFRCDRNDVAAISLQSTMYETWAEKITFVKWPKAPINQSPNSIHILYPIELALHDKRLKNLFSHPFWLSCRLRWLWFGI